MSAEPGDKQLPDDPANQEDAHPSMAGERTELAWTRSAIAFFALGVGVLKFRPDIGIPLLVFSAVLWLINRRPPRRDRDGAISHRLLLVSLAVTGLAVLVLILTLAGPVSPGLRP